MTEAEWERCINRELMLEFLQDRISVRKFQLFAVACCRRQWKLFPKTPHQCVIVAAEAFADGVGTMEELQTLSEPVTRAWSKTELTREQRHLDNAAHSLVRVGAGNATSPYDTLWRRVFSTAQSVSEGIAARLGDYTTEFHESNRDEMEQITLLHDIAGNPFYPEAVEPAWLTSTVTALAHTMYESRDFSAMPILADALQDADCDNDIILEHCRGPGPHVRGCWVVDLILGKE